MIRVSDLSRSFGGREVVRGASFEVAAGEVVGLLGPNGAGKTTTMRLLLGLLRPHGGTAALGGRAGYLPESFVAYDALSVASYLRFCCHTRRLPADAVGPAMAVAQVDELAGRPVARLSRGQRQRVGLAQAVLGWPPVLVLDEPTAGLDPAQVVDARALVAQAAAEGAAVLVSTHLLAEAASVCDRVVILADGAVVAEERPGAAGDLERRYLAVVAGAVGVDAGVTGHLLAKELRVLWCSPAPYVGGAALHAVLGVLAVDQLQGRAQAVAQPLFPIAGLLLLLLVPLLTMRTFAEEARTGTLDLLLVAPVGARPLVVGKWLASWLSALVLLTPALLLAGLLVLWGDPDPGPVLTGFLGLALLAGAVAALGTLASALTSNQAVAATVAAFVALALWFGGNVGAAGGGRSLLARVSFGERLRLFAGGAVDLGDLVFFVAVAAGCLVLAALAIDARRLR